MKLNLLFFLCFFTSLLDAQREFNAKMGSGMPNINIPYEYFSEMDSVFVCANKISEVSVSQTLIKKGITIYEKPLLLNRYNIQGKLIHFDQNNWSEEGGHINSWDDYGDSTVFVGLEKYTFSDSEIDKTWRSTFYRVSDTLARVFDQFYYKDSLLRTEETWIYKEELKKRQVWTRENFQSRKKEKEMNIRVLNPETSLEPNPVMETDRFGRAVKISAGTIKTIGDKNCLVPVKTILVSYLDTTVTSVLKSVKAFSHYDDKLFHEIVEKEGEKWTSYTWPECYAQKCMYYELKAGYFKYGLPQLVKVSYGNNLEFIMIYKVSIKTR